MAAFPTAGHLASWAGMCLGQHDSAGRHGSGKTRLRGALVHAPAGLTRQGRLLSVRYRQVVRRRRDAKAIVCSGYQILLAAYCVLVPAQPYKDPGPTTLSRLTAQRLTHQAVVHIATCTDAA
jgi:transposase